MITSEFVLIAMRDIRPQGPMDIHKLVVMCVVLDTVVPQTTLVVELVAVSFALEILLKQVQVMLHVPLVIRMPQIVVEPLLKIAAPAKDTITAAPSTGQVAASRHFAVATAAAAVGHATRPATTSVVRGI